MRGTVVIAEYADHLEAKVAAARLTEAGFESTVLIDPAAGVAPHHVTDPMAAVVVAEGTAEAAAAVLAEVPADEEAERLDAAFHHRRFSDRPAWVRYATWALILAIPGPVALAALWVLWRMLQGLFP